MATRGRKKDVTIASQLLEAVKFVGLGLKATGSEAEQFCMVNNGWLTSFNGVIALGVPIQQELVAAPHNKRWDAALAGCSALDLQITQLVDEFGSRLHVRSGDFQAFVPCCPNENAGKLTWPTPDMAKTLVNESERSFKQAVLTASVLASAKAKSPLAACIMLNSGSCTATNNTCIIEAWHGYGTRDGMAIPRMAADILKKIKKTLISVGWNEHSFTFHFDDRSYMKTLLYTEDIPDIRKYMDKGQMQNAIAPPADFFNVVGKLSKFAYDGRVYCGNGAITAYDNEAKQISSEGSYEVTGAPQNLSFYASDLMDIKDLVTMIDFRALPNAAMFYGQAVRGAVHWDDTMPKVEVKIDRPEWKPSNSAACYECGGDWPHELDTCPHCGNEIPF